MPEKGDQVMRGYGKGYCVGMFVPEPSRIWVFGFTRICD